MLPQSKNSIKLYRVDTGAGRGRGSGLPPSGQRAEPRETFNANHRDPPSLLYGYALLTFSPPPRTPPPPAPRPRPQWLVHSGGSPVSLAPSWVSQISLCSLGQGRPLRGKVLRSPDIHRSELQPAPNSAVQTCYSFERRRPSATPAEAEPVPDSFLLSLPVPAGPGSASWPVWQSCPPSRAPLSCWDTAWEVFRGWSPGSQLWAGTGQLGNKKLP